MISLIDRARSGLSYSVWYVQTLVSEARSLPHRMRMLSHKRNHPIDLGPIYEEGPDGELLPCKATIARTQYVEFLLARYPWASEADVLLAVDGWDKGTECFLRTRDIGKIDEIPASGQYHLALNE
jgi:hypothetical protein